MKATIALGVFIAMAACGGSQATPEFEPEPTTNGDTVPAPTTGPSVTDTPEQTLAKMLDQLLAACSHEDIDALYDAAAVFFADTDYEHVVESCADLFGGLTHEAVGHRVSGYSTDIEGGTEIHVLEISVDDQNGGTRSYTARYIMVDGAYKLLEGETEWGSAEQVPDLPVAEAEAVVEACFAAFDKYVQCIESVPEDMMSKATAETVLDALRQSIDIWKDMANTDEGKQDLARACTYAIEGWQMSAESFGCTL